MTIDELSIWREEEYANLNVYTVTYRNTSALFLNIVPFQCLDYTTVEAEKLDILWSGRYESILVPQDLRLCKIMAYHPMVANRMRTRRQQALQSASTHGKTIIPACLKCWNCDINPLVERCMEERMQNHLDISQVTLF